MKVKEEREKPGLQVSIKKAAIMASGPVTSWQIEGEAVETVTVAASTLMLFLAITHPPGRRAAPCTGVWFPLPSLRGAG